jgi:hypothetical protein
MRINDIILEKAAVKPRNFVAKNAMKTTSGAGKHKDKKKSQKQGYEKHKSKSVSESLRPGEYHVATVTLDDGTVKKVKVFSDEGFRDRIQQTFAKQGQRVKDIKMDYGVYSEGMVKETATAGATSAGNVAVGAVYKNKKGRTYKNPDGTAKNALDVKGANLLTGGSVAKR